MNTTPPGKVPPLSQLIAKIKSLHTDRAALVREPKDGRPAGVMILMLSPAAVRDIGPIIIEHVKALNLPAEHSKHVIHMDEGVGAAELFAEMERLGLQFNYSQHLGDTIAVLLGNITPELCAALSAKRCPTTLR